MLARSISPWVVKLLIKLMTEVNNLRVDLPHFAVQLNKSGVIDLSINYDQSQLQNLLRVNKPTLPAGQYRSEAVHCICMHLAVLLNHTSQVE